MSSEHKQLGDLIAARELRAVSGEYVRVPDAQPVHLQFRRFAGCPICNLHLQSFARAHERVRAAGIREIAVFHAPAEELLPHVANLPFPVIGDPDKRMYREFGVEEAPRALLDPRVWPSIATAIAAAAIALARGRGAPPRRRPTGGRLGLPADFLIAPDGRVVACKYGAHADDQWSVDELLALAAQPDIGAALSPHS
jgi:peroxiredoxin